MPRKKPERKAKGNDVLERRIKDFGEEVQELGERLGKRMEELGKRAEKKDHSHESWFSSTFGLVGPFVSSVLGIAVFAIFTWILTIINVPVQSGFLSNITSFLMANIGIFFLIMLYFSYTSYFSKSEPALYWPVSPIFTALGIVIGFWVASEAIKIVNIPLGISWLWTVAVEIGRNLFLLFWLAMLLGYLVLLLRSTGCCEDGSSPRSAPKASVKAVEQRRLYRSGREKILGGVCGGISEYLGIDPVIVRILFVLAALAWGFGIVLYIILWIIMPRNPKHKW